LDLSGFLFYLWNISRSMTDKEYNEQLRYALDEPESRFSIFMKRVAGYRFFPIDSIICVDKYILYARLKDHPHFLELLEQGKHPDYRRVMKEDFDVIQQQQWEIQANQNLINEQQ